MEKCKAAAAKKALLGPGKGAQTGQGVTSALARTEGYNVAYVGNIAYDVTREELIELFKCVGGSSRGILTSPGPTTAEAGADAGAGELDSWHIVMLCRTLTLQINVCRNAKHKILGGG